MDKIIVTVLGYKTFISEMSYAPDCLLINCCLIDYRVHTVMAATRRGWVTAITWPSAAQPASRRYCGICVDFPHPVSPTITTVWYLSTRYRMWFLSWNITKSNFNIPIHHEGISVNFPHPVSPRITTVWYLSTRYRMWFLSWNITRSNFNIHVPIHCGSDPPQCYLYPTSAPCLSHLHYNICYIFRLCLLDQYEPSCSIIFSSNKCNINN